MPNNKAATMETIAATAMSIKSVIAGEALITNEDSSQRGVLGAITFQRIHRNMWLSSESRFIDEQTYDACVVDGHPDLSGSLFIGVDAAVRKDNAAIVCLKYADESDQLVLADYKIWKPLPGQPINLEASVEFYLRRVYS